MIFVTDVGGSKDSLQILSIKFSDYEQEQLFKTGIAIKLYETNTKQSFNDLAETSYITQTYITNDDDGYKETDLEEIVEGIDMMTLDDDSKYNDLSSNKDITGSKLHNRVYVVREIRTGKSALGYFKHDNENELTYKGKIQIKNLENEPFTPSKVIQYKSDGNLLLLNNNDPSTVSVLNLTKGKVVEEWETISSYYGGVKDICPINKNADMSDIQQIYGMNKDSIFMIDGRIPADSKVVHSKSISYTNDMQFNTISTSGIGFIAVGSGDGKIRLYNNVGQKAKTRLPGLGNKINYIEVSNDGLWILATCTDYIMVIPTKVKGTERTGFEGQGMTKKINLMHIY